MSSEGRSFSKKPLASDFTQPLCHVPTNVSRGTQKPSSGKEDRGREGKVGLRTHSSSKDTDEESVVVVIEGTAGDASS